MLGAIAIIASNTLFVLIEFIWKAQRLKGASSLASLATFGFAVPILLLGIFIVLPALNQGVSVNHSLEYWLYLLVWLVPVFVSNFGYVYLFKYQSLTEQNTYKLAFTVFVAILLDIYFLETTYSYVMYVVIGLFLLAGFMLTKNRSLLSNGLSLKVALIILLGVSVLGALEWSIYKKAFIFQDSVLMHIFVAQTLLFSLFFIIGFKSLIRSLQQRQISVLQILAIVLLLVPFVSLEGFALSELPVAVVVLGSIWPMALYSAYDFRNKQLKISRQSLFALGLVTIGILLLGVTAV